MSGQLFTIALPVRNGGDHLKLCVESILAQRCGDFELVILDNVSTDGTSEWLNRLTDPRVRLYPSKRRLSIEENWSRIKEIPKNEFFTTIGHDDLLDPCFLEVIRRLIEKHRDASLYLTHFRLVDADGALLRHCRPMPLRETAGEFLASRLCHLRDSFGTGYVLRSTTYDALGGIPPYGSLLYADDALFLQATAISYRATALEEAFSYRFHPASASGACTAADLFRSFECFCDLLRTMQETDPSIHEALRRYFADYAMTVARSWLMEERLAAYHGQHSLRPDIEPRAQALVTLFGGKPKPILSGNVLYRVLEKAMTSPIYDALYRILSFEFRAQKRLEKWFLQKM